MFHSIINMKSSVIALVFLSTLAVAIPWIAPSMFSLSPLNDSYTLWM